MALLIVGVSIPVAAEGEPDGTFPSWEERWIHQLINRARCDPQYEMASCSTCAEAACYSPSKPLTWTKELNRAARFHSANLSASGCGMKHNSPCTLVTNIDALYPDPCDGSVSCACEPGTVNCSATAGTSAWDRIVLFGTIGYGENIAWAGPDLDSIFYAWLFESTSNSSCGFRSDNGHRYNILAELSQVKSVGTGMAGDFTTSDFGPGPAPGKVPSGSHYPRQAATVELWANWYDTAGPLAAAVNLAGTCHPMSLERGTATNGAWMAEVTGVATGCHRYYFEFQDSVGTVVTYPTTGSLAVGPATGCPEWDASRPAPCLSSDAIFSDGFETGSTIRWSNTIP